MNPIERFILIWHMTMWGLFYVTKGDGRDGKVRREHQVRNVQKAKRSDFWSNLFGQADSQFSTDAIPCRDIEFGIGEISS